MSFGYLFCSVAEHFQTPSKKHANAFSKGCPSADEEKDCNSIRILHSLRSSSVIMFRSFPYGLHMVFHFFFIFMYVTRPVTSITTPAVQDAVGATRCLQRGRRCTCKVIMPSRISYILVVMNLTETITLSHNGFLHTLG